MTNVSSATSQNDHNLIPHISQHGSGRSSCDKCCFLLIRINMDHDGRQHGELTHHAIILTSSTEWCRSTHGRL